MEYFPEIIKDDNSVMSENEFNNLTPIKQFNIMSPTQVIEFLGKKEFMMKNWEKIFFINLEQDIEDVKTIIDDIYKEDGNGDIVTDDVIKKNEINVKDIKKCNFNIGLILSDDFMKNKATVTKLENVFSHIFSKYKTNNETDVTADEAYEADLIAYRKMEKENPVRIYVKNKTNFIRNNPDPKKNGKYFSNIVIKEFVDITPIDTINMKLSEDIDYIKDGNTLNIKAFLKLLRKPAPYIEMVYGDNYKILYTDIKKSKKQVYVFLAKNNYLELDYELNRGHSNNGYFSCHKNIPSYCKYTVTYGDDGNKTYTEYKLASEKNTTEKFASGVDRFAGKLKNMFGKEEEPAAGGKTRKHRKRKMRSSKRKASKKGRKSRKKKSSSRKKK